MQKRGVFWVIEDELLAIPFDGNVSFGIAKSGSNFNHRLLWDYVKPKGCNRPFDYYPRGRVEINKRGDPVIYMSPQISEAFIQQITECFGLIRNPKIHYDGSLHYKCHLDRNYQKKFNPQSDGKPLLNAGFKKIIVVHLDNRQYQECNIVNKENSTVYNIVPYGDLKGSLSIDRGLTLGRREMGYEDTIRFLGFFLEKGMS
ncbi:hypothetical protein [Butyrivibrio sp. AC2005]|uniref:hypothetical protein n=1 Tax=Butyrivibrio sp. AC2005 TaxID=1280672 RepID=UPI00040B9FF0|nr:hypothetical protein [Butyrivibrio sp. AC2005]